ncbi:MAG: GMC family oxidoreductase N-terminal domain-containing protein [Devosia sp.]|nr:GMC family oxidoreductase N-terminal domain-containing protein [Devosia sp.]
MPTGGYDTITVGGGTAGSVLANWLSARSCRRILLLEAGQEGPDGHLPPDISDSYPAVVS